MHSISLISLNSWGQAKFKYSYLPPSFEVPFKDKTVTKLKRSKADNTSGTWCLFLMMAAERTWVRIETMAPTVRPDNSPSTFIALDWGACSGTPNKSHIALAILLPIEIVKPSFTKYMTVPRLAPNVLARPNTQYQDTNRRFALFVFDRISSPPTLHKIYHPLIVSLNRMNVMSLKTLQRSC